MNHAIIDAVRRGADLLVIVGLGNGASPVDDEVAAVVIGHARRSQVDVARDGAGFELQLRFREVRARNKLFDLLVAIHAHFHGAVVALDDAVHQLVLRQGFHSHVVGREVKCKLVAHVAHVLRGLTTDFSDAICGFRFNIKKLGVGFAKARLLLLEGLVCDVLIGVHRSPLRCAKPDCSESENPQSGSENQHMSLWQRREASRLTWSERRTAAEPKLWSDFYVWVTALESCEIGC